MKVMLVTAESTYLYLSCTHTYSFESHRLSGSAWVDLEKREQCSITVLFLCIPEGALSTFSLRTLAFSRFCKQRRVGTMT